MDKETITVNGIECPAIVIDGIKYPEIIPDVIEDKSDKSK